MNILITGGAGFIGCNAAAHFARKGAQVFVFDNLSRFGSAENVRYLQQEYPGAVEFIYGDIRQEYDLARAFHSREFDRVLHLASQVAVTTSVANPREDFEINAIGTFNVLECLRNTGSRAILIYSSTNKVYGGMEDVVIVERNGRYEYRDYPNGLSEDRLLDFHSPYGCSKGAGDQYVRDYSRIYGLRTIVMRQSCIYGYRQFGIEDQGWVAWFAIAASLGTPLTIYGDGKQVRDVLFVDDLIAAYDTAAEQIAVTNGQAYNIGGGRFRMSLLELLAHLEKMIGNKIPVRFSSWRPGDQRVYVSDVAKAERDFGWKPTISLEEGLQRLLNWILPNREMFERFRWNS